MNLRWCIIYTENRKKSEPILQFFDSESNCWKGVPTIIEDITPRGRVQRKRFYSQK